MMGEVEETRTVYSGRQGRSGFQSLALTRVTLDTWPDEGEPTVPRVTQDCAQTIRFIGTQGSTEPSGWHDQKKSQGISAVTCHHALPGQGQGEKLNSVLGLLVEAPVLPCGLQGLSLFLVFSFQLLCSFQPAQDIKAPES